MPRTHTNPASRTSAVGWIGVLAMLGAAMVTAEIISGSMMPLMADGLNTSEGMIGQAVTASAIVAIVTSLSIGKLCGDHDRRVILIVMSLFLVASNLGVALSPNVWSMLASRLLLGAAIGIIWGLMPAVVLRLAPEGEFPHSFASVVLGVAAAGVVAAPAAAYLGDLFSWRAVYLGATALAVLATAMLVLWFPSLPAQPGALNRDLRGTLNLPGLVAGMVGVMLMFGGMQAFFGYLVPFMEQISGFDTTEVSFTLLLTGISGVIGTLVASRLLGISLYGVMVISPAAMSLLLVLLVYVGHTRIPTMAILTLWLGLRALIGVAVNAWIAHNFPEKVESAGGILVAVIQGSMMLGAILGGVLIDNAGAKVIATAGAIILAVATVYCYRMMKPRSFSHAADDPLLAPVAPLPASPGLVTDEPV